MFERLYSALHVQELLTSPLAVLDILLLAFVIYHLLQLVRGTRSANMMIALFVLGLALSIFLPMWEMTGLARRG